MASYSADDLALAALLRIVPDGYRVIDINDERFPGVRDRFVRLALRHLGPRPALVGFTGPGQDPREAAAAAARWAATNLRPTAIQRRVDPGVVVVALEPPPGVDAGGLKGLPVKTAVWVVRDGRLKAAGRPSGPSPRLVRAAVDSLARGEPPPSIGTIDVAERTLMAGRARRRSLTLGSGAAIGIVVAAYLLLRLIPGLFFARAPGPQAPRLCAQNCVALTDADAGRNLTVDPGTQVVLTLPGGGGGQAGCPADSDPAVLQFVLCDSTAGESGRAVSVYRAAAAGSATLGRDQFSVTITVR